VKITVAWRRYVAARAGRAIGGAGGGAARQRSAEQAALYQAAYLASAAGSAKIVKKAACSSNQALLQGVIEKLASGSARRGIDGQRRIAAW